MKVIDVKVFWNIIVKKFNFFWLLINTINRLASFYLVTLLNLILDIIISKVKSIQKNLLII